METHIHTRIYKLRGSPAWKHTFTQEDIQAMWESSINTIGHTSSVGVQHGNIHSHRIYRRPWESSMETHIHTRGYTQKRRIGPDFGGQVEDNYRFNLEKKVFVFFLLLHVVMRSVSNEQFLTRYD